MKTINSLLSCLVLVFFNGCSTKTYPDLSAYDIEEFTYYRAACTRSSQCRVIGFGYGSSCDTERNFEGFVVYSTKMGQKNINHLKNLVAESRGELRGYSNQTYFSSYAEELDECQPYDVHVPEPVCLENVCRGRLTYYTN